MVVSALANPLIFVPVTNQDLDFQHHMLWVFFVFNEFFHNLTYSLYKIGQNPYINEFAREHASNNSHNSQFFNKKKQISYPKRSIPISLIFQPI
jgi:hypothetical protein